MAEEANAENRPGEADSFYERPNVRQDTIQIGGGIPFGIEQVSNKELAIGGAYGAWGRSYNNAQLPEFVASRMGHALDEHDQMELGELGFVSRQHVPLLTDEENHELELEVGTRLIKEAAQSNGWEPSQVQGLLVGTSGPITADYVSELALRAGIPEEALKVSVHKACDGSVGALNLALNPDLGRAGQVNIAEELRGKKVLVGGIEGLSRFMGRSQDKNALQLFGNGFGMIGLIPGKTLRFLVGKSMDVFDEEGLLKVRMVYPHSGLKAIGKLVDVVQEGASFIRVAGLMHEPEDGSNVAMAGLMGMVKLFVRSGVQAVTDVFGSYQKLMEKLGTPDKKLATAIVHHANYKINKLKEKQLLKEGISFPMPWLLKDFGNVSAASNMIAFLRQLPQIRPGDHVLFDGFGAGTYYDVLAVELGV
ncbi:MAG TPA: 3-oxoacyl-[acyl-carrier-protein] synthase III C-terminal domain-containing protein [Anaerolineales bacterium]|nr:3-oxoacyl-[acyl-carrier-protein] synthase III C-terminal domain-containing protein [Anaerolineales bacterium]